MFNNKHTMKRTLRQIALIGAISLSTSAFADSISMDVFAIPSKPITELIKHTSDTLKKEGITTFYEKGMPVHATLYLTNFPESAKSEIKKAVEKIAKQYRPFPITAKGLTVTKGNWAFINLDDSNKLQRLADEVTLAIEPLRDQHAPLPGWVKNYPNKLAAFKRYGSPNVFQNFEPHLTLLANEKNPKLASFNMKMKKHPPEAQGEIIGIGIGITDEWGQQKEVIARYYFHK